MGCTCKALWLKPGDIFNWKMQTSETEQAWSAAKYCENTHYGQEDRGAEEEREGNGKAQLLRNTDRDYFF